MLSTLETEALLREPETQCKCMHREGESGGGGEREGKFVTGNETERLKVYMYIIWELDFTHVLHTYRSYAVAFSTALMVALQQEKYKVNKILRPYMYTPALP